MADTPTNLSIEDAAISAPARVAGALSAPTGVQTGELAVAYPIGR